MRFLIEFYLNLRFGGGEVVGTMTLSLINHDNFSLCRNVPRIVSFLARWWC